MPSGPLVWAPVHSAWNHKAVISSWIGQDSECRLQNAECRFESNRIPKPGNPNSEIESPMLALYLDGTGLPARPGLAPRPTTEFFSAEKDIYGHCVTEWLRQAGLLP